MSIRRSISDDAKRFVIGQRVYSKRCGRIGGFTGEVIALRGGGFQVRSDADGEVYQRDRWDLMALPQSMQGATNTAS